MTLQQQAAQGLIDGAKDGLMWYIGSIPERDDMSRMLSDLEPIKTHLVETDDQVQLGIAQGYIKSLFKNGTHLAQIFKKDVEKGRLQQYNNENYLQNLPFYEKDGVYWHRKSNATVPISNFSMEIQDRIMLDDEIFYRCTLRAVGGEVVENVEFSPMERVDARKFRVAIQGVGDFHFNGRDHELSGIWQYEQNRAPKRMIVMVRRFGRIQERDMWLFGNCAINNSKVYLKNPDTDYVEIDNYNIRSQDVRVYQNAVPLIDTETEYTKTLAEEISNHFNIMLDAKGTGTIKSYMGLLFLSFLPATIYSDEIFTHTNFFPILFSYGPKSTGKSEATGLLASFFGFRGRRESWGDASVAGLTQVSAQLSSLPYWMDEFQNGPQFERLLSTLKNMYNRVGVGKGGLKERRTIREVLSTLWLSGEYIPDDEAFVSRCILFRFNRINPYKTKSYQWLVHHRDKLTVLTRHLIQDKSDDKVRRLIESIETYDDDLQHKGIEPRISKNYAIMAASLQLLDITIPENFFEWIVDHAKTTTQYIQEENITILFFRELNTAWSKGLIARKFIEIDFKRNELCIIFDSVISEIRKHIKQQGDNWRYKNSEIRDYFKDLPGYVMAPDKNGVRRSFLVGKRYQQKNCISFQIDLLPDGYKETISEIVDDFETFREENKRAIDE